MASACSSGSVERSATWSCRAAPCADLHGQVRAPVPLEPTRGPSSTCPPARTSARGCSGLPPRARCCRRRVRGRGSPRGSRRLCRSLPGRRASTPRTFLACDIETASPLSIGELQCLLADLLGSRVTLAVADEGEVGGDLGAHGQSTVGLEQLGCALEVRSGHIPVAEPVMDLCQLVLDDGESVRRRRRRGGCRLLVGDEGVVVAAERGEGITGRRMVDGWVVSERECRPKVARVPRVCVQRDATAARRPSTTRGPPAHDQPEQGVERPGRPAPALPVAAWRRTRASAARPLSRRRRARPMRCEDHVAAARRGGSRSRVARYPRRAGRGSPRPQGPGQSRPRRAH